MDKLTFDPENSLAGGLYSLSPREVMDLGIALCAAVDEAVGAQGCHGSVWPGNVCYADKKAAIGPSSGVSIKDISPDALEYIAPEQFWNGESSPASDVYSIGLMLYTALNGGVMPFSAGAGERSPEDRAAALQSRMKGRELEYPRYACRELGDTVLKAMSFKAEDRYENPARLKAALAALPEGAAVPARAPVIRLSAEEVKKVRSYTVDKNFEPMEPEKPAKKPKKSKGAKTVDENMDAEEFRRSKAKKNRVLPFLIILIAVAAAIAVLLQSCETGPDNPSYGSSQEEPSSGDNVSIPVEPDPVNSPVPTEKPSEPPVESPEVSATPTPQPRYELIIEDLTWEEAKAKCEAMGGHLATVRSQDEFDYIVAMAEDAGAQFVWLGSYRGSDGIWYNVTGETMSFSAWDIGEPSAMDADGTREDYLLLWYRPAADTWTYNDMRNDPISVIPATYSGKISFVCQYD